jgi:hypothetical protein
MARKLGLCFIMLALALCAGPASAGEVAAPAVTPTQAAPAQTGCALALDLAAVLSNQGEICPAALPDSTPELMARPPRLRTCVCSCGYPCETDADCGPGGNCGPGITCC